jgi:hypothetical protein
MGVLAGRIEGLPRFFVPEGRELDVGLGVVFFMVFSAKNGRGTRLSIRSGARGF